jgi:maleate cis-trans isomerase
MTQREQGKKPMNRPDERPSGWRAKIGVITPTVNTITEPELNRIAPQGVTVHFTRMPIHRHPEQDGFRSLFADLDARVGELATCGVDVVAYNCTVGSMSCPADVLLGRIRETSGVPAVATADAVLAAFRALGVSRVALATPYDEATNAHEADYLSRHGITVVASAGYPFTEGDAAAGRQYARVPPSGIYKHALSVDRPDADAIFVSCANFGSAGVVEALEEAAQKPVVTSNLACAWAAFRAAGIDDPIIGFGQLLGEY